MPDIRMTKVGKFIGPVVPIFWYRPEGSATYRVIYADLSVRDVAPEDVPQ